ncbi:MFS transporter [Alteromonas pelagimontana]|uniref:MFS transporter n=1 Tax=Alteromonas pelagimontana TaxID=1858656 RepID=A0A6M4MDQ2_9ALTE|nr:MFS transporter [Alteromonas pelagimontana]QJR80715.1 MFS transporter [Alteromonas pelagimontana]
MVSLSKWQRVSYASGAFAKSLQWNSTEFILLYYFAEIVGLGTMQAGLILFISFIWSGLLDICFARFFDNKNVNYQKVIAVSAPFCAFTFALLFLPISLPGNWLFSYYLAVTLLFRIGYTLVDIPHNAMLGSLSTNSYERTRLSASRIFFNSCAVLVFAFCAGHLLGLLENGSMQNLLIFLLIFSLFYLINIGVCVIPTWHLRAASPQVSSEQSFAVALKMLMQNKPFLILLLFTLISDALMSIFSKSSVYYASVVLGDDTKATSLIVGLAIGKIIAMPMFSRIAESVEKHQAMIFACLGKAVAIAIFWLWSPTTVSSAFTCYFIYGIFSGGLHMLVWSALPDTIEYGKHHFKTFNSALTFGVFHVVMRVGNGISFGLIALMLMMLDYPAGGENLVDNLIRAISILAGMGALLAPVILLFYPLSHAMHQELAQEKSTANSSIH